MHIYRLSVWVQELHRFYLLLLSRMGEAAWLPLWRLSKRTHCFPLSSPAVLLFQLLSNFLPMFWENIYATKFYNSLVEAMELFCEDAQDTCWRSLAICNSQFCWDSLICFFSHILSHDRCKIPSLLPFSLLQIMGYSKPSMQDPIQLFLEKQWWGLFHDRVMRIMTNYKP